MPKPETGEDRRKAGSGVGDELHPHGESRPFWPCSVSAPSEPPVTSTRTGHSTSTRNTSAITSGATNTAQSLTRYPHPSRDCGGSSDRSCCVFSRRRRATPKPDDPDHTGREGSRSRVGCANDRPCESTRYLLYEIALALEPPTVVEKDGIRVRHAGSRDVAGERRRGDEARVRQARASRGGDDAFVGAPAASRCAGARGGVGARRRASRPHAGRDGPAGGHKTPFGTETGFAWSAGGALTSLRRRSDRDA